MMQAEPEAVQHAQQSSPSPFKQQVQKAIEHVAKLRAKNQRGPLAELRKLSPARNRIPPAVFWDVVEECQIRPQGEDLWLTMLPLMVRHPHTPQVKLGQALAGANVSASRVERWLRLDRAAAWREARRLLSHLKGEGFDWTRFAPLLRGWDHPVYGERRRRDFAGEFFLSDAYLKRKPQGDDA